VSHNDHQHTRLADPLPPHRSSCNASLRLCPRVENVRLNSVNLARDRRRRYGRSAFTLTELMFAMGIGSMIAVMFFSVIRTASIVTKKSSVQAELYGEGKIALERVLRCIRQEMVGLTAVGYGSGTWTNALIILADTDNDGVGDCLKGWGVRPYDDDGDGAQDTIDMDHDGVFETKLWELVQVVSPSTDLATATWNVEVLCKNLALPWTTVDGKYTYRPFMYLGANPALDDDGDGVVSETEVGNSVTTNGVIDHVAEVEAIGTIGLGMRLIKRSAFGAFESVIIFRGTIDPRNWHALYFKN